jgi:acetyl-CoA/propionyl-CoA carboxylase biotin carboxyl carrier protein
VHISAAALWRHDVTEGAWASDGWRLGAPRPTRYEVGDVEVSVLGDTVAVGQDDPVPARLVRRGPHAADLELGGVVHPLRLVTAGSVTWVGDQGSAFELRFRTRVERLTEELAALTRGTRPVDPQVRSPMPGTVVSVEVGTGDSVVAGQILLTIEAMKMEHRVVAPSDGIVTLTVRPTDQVALDHVVATITGHPDEGTPA